MTSPEECLPLSFASSACTASVKWPKRLFGVSHVSVNIRNPFWPKLRGGTQPWEDFGPEEGEVPHSHTSDQDDSCHNQDCRDASGWVKPHVALPW